VKLPRGSQTFRKRDIVTAVKAARSAGVEIGRIEIDAVTGKIIIVAAYGPLDGQGSPLDQWLARNGN
jgi:hypothetical protein